MYLLIPITPAGNAISVNEDGSVYEPKHVARNITNTPNKLRVVYDYIILYHIYRSVSLFISGIHTTSILAFLMADINYLNR